MIKWIMYVYTLKDDIKFDGEARPQAMPIFILYASILKSSVEERLFDLLWLPV